MKMVEDCYWWNIAFEGVRMVDYLANNLTDCIVERL